MYTWVHRWATKWAASGIFFQASFKPNITFLRATLLLIGRRNSCLSMRVAKQRRFVQINSTTRPTSPYQGSPGTPPSQKTSLFHASSIHLGTMSPESHPVSPGREISIGGGIASGATSYRPANSHLGGLESSPSNAVRSWLTLDIIQG